MKKITATTFLFALWFGVFVGVAAADVADYRVGANDLLRINVYGYPELASEVRVSESGVISLPLIGGVNVAGKASNEIEGLIARRLVDGNFIRQPHVSVLVLQYQSQTVSVLGQVVKPGQYPLEKISRVIDLLAAAGGVDNVKGADEATLLHSDGSKQNLDLIALFQGDSVQNPVVKDGDTIYVPKALQFYIYGEVQHPGVYRFERNMTLSQAITAGGGLTPRGSENAPLVKRRSDDSKEQQITLKSSDAVQAGDVIFIKESWF